MRLKKCFHKIWILGFQGEYNSIKEPNLLIKVSAWQVSDFLDNETCNPQKSFISRRTNVFRSRGVLSRNFSSFLYWLQTYLLQRAWVLSLWSKLYSSLNWPDLMLKIFVQRLNNFEFSATFMRRPNPNANIFCRVQNKQSDKCSRRWAKNNSSTWSLIRETSASGLFTRRPSSRQQTASTPMRYAKPSIERKPVCKQKWWLTSTSSMIRNR